MVDDFGDRRQIVEHVGFHAAQDEGRDFFAQVLEIFRLLLPGDADIFFHKPIVGPQKARHEEVEEAPELIERIFDRRSRQDEAVVGLDHLDRFGVAGSAVLNMLRFVEDDISEVGLSYNVRYLFAGVCKR